VLTVSASADTLSLPELLYLLGIDLDKHKQSERLKLAYVVRAAALTELSLRGNIVDANGKIDMHHESSTGHPVLDGVLHEIADDRPRSWKDWIRRHERQTLEAVESQLKSAGAITIEKHLLLGDKVWVTDVARVRTLQRLVLDALTGGQPIDQLEPRTIALTALAANGELGTVIPHKVRKAHKDRVHTLTERAGPSAAALRSAVSELWWRRGSNSGAVAAANAR
jgi:hypothetical protein